MEGFLHLEPMLKEWFRIDRNNPYIQEVFMNYVSWKMKEAPDKGNFKNEKGRYNLNAYAEAHFNELAKEELFLKIPTDTCLDTIDDFCKKYQLGITKEDDAYQVLLLAYVLLMMSKNTESTPLEDINYAMEEYIYAVRPDMLKLYIGLHSKDNKDRKDNKKSYYRQCRISFGDLKPIKIDEQTPWFQIALDRYLTQYLGVNSIEEAERELNLVYGKTVGAKMNVTEIIYMWGTYHLLQTIPKWKSKTKNSVTRAQGRIIADLLNRFNLIDYKDKESYEDYEDGERIRALLNSYLKQCDSIDDIIKAREYKLSPNNKDTTRFF